jgi:hypothetical protein
MSLSELSALHQNPAAPFTGTNISDPYGNPSPSQRVVGNLSQSRSPVGVQNLASPEPKNNSYDPLDVVEAMSIQPIKIKLPIEPLS